MILLENYQSGHKEKSLGYSYFVPSYVNEEWIWNQPEINQLLERAAVKLGELNSFSRLVPNVDLFIQMYVAKEAMVSSRIEGTQTNMNEVFLPELEISSERRSDWREVNNYINALNQAIAEMEELPLSSRLIRRTHDMLLSGVRGESKLPGEFRRSQNWIGGRTLKDAVFIPPHFDLVDDLMRDLENFLHNDEIRTPSLIRIAIAHYQFETIHPFLDGNGRIGRLLIPLYLVSARILDRPLLYLSHFFEQDKSLYYDNLMRVRTSHDMTQWLRYFLVGVEKTAEEAVNVLVQVLQLKNQAEQKIQLQLGRKAHKGLVLLSGLFTNPIISIQDAANTCQLSFKAASDLVHNLVDLDILKEFTGQTRNRLYEFHQYLSVFEGE